METSEFLQSVMLASSGLIGVVVGAWLTSWRDRVARQQSFLKQQLDDFYSPMLGIRQEILTKSQLRLEISQTANEAWHELCKGKSPEELKRLSERTWPAFDKIVKYNNRQLTEELLPAYGRMLDLFRKNLWLANETTKQHYQELMKFVELWNRWVDRSLPAEVMDKLGHTEERLKPLYEDLEKNVTLLRNQASEGALEQIDGRKLRLGRVELATLVFTGSVALFTGMLWLTSKDANRISRELVGRPVTTIAKFEHEALPEKDKDGQSKKRLLLSLQNDGKMPAYIIGIFADWFWTGTPDTPELNRPPRRSFSNREFSGYGVILLQQFNDNFRMVDVTIPANSQPFKLEGFYVPPPSEEFLIGNDLEMDLVIVYTDDRREKERLLRQLDYNAIYKKARDLLPINQRVLRRLREIKGVRYVDVESFRYDKTLNLWSRITAPIEVGFQ
ncbi:MAG: hypothetical protein HY590_07880 [Candidatus Omnitrophica bacterium]|nr:hypothetical protein [Candidatus Omnitrophota bacterium]